MVARSRSQPRLPSIHSAHFDARLVIVIARRRVECRQAPHKRSPRLPRPARESPTAAPCSDWTKRRRSPPRRGDAPTDDLLAPFPVPPSTSPPSSAPHSEAKYRAGLLRGVGARRGYLQRPTLHRTPQRLARPSSAVA